MAESVLGLILCFRRQTGRIISEHWPWHGEIAQDVRMSSSLTWSGANHWTVNGVDLERENSVKLVSRLGPSKSPRESDTV
jgi:hypothetical protein